MNTIHSTDHREDRRPGRPRRRMLLAAATAIALAASTAVLGLGSASASALSVPSAVVKPATVVSLTFDDGNVDQKTAAATLAQNKLNGTFFINSGFIGAANYLTLADLTSLAAAGNEIGGHTVSHPSLIAISADEAKRQICNDRVTLTNWGFKVTSFAYPFADSNSLVESYVNGCGYNSARGLGDLQTRFGCTGCQLAETVPPTDKFLTKALDEVDSTWTLADLQSAVTSAEAKGGWVQFTFHHICANACDALAITPALFTQFSQWLAARQANVTLNTKVKTVAAVIGGAVKVTKSGPVVAPAAAGVNAIKNPSLETAGLAANTPQCWMIGGYGANTAAFSTVATAHTGTKAEKLTVTGYSDGDAKLLPTFDLGACSPTVVAAHTYSLREWYTSSTVTQFALYARNSTGVWQYWTSSPWYAASTAYTQAVWTTPAIPAGTTAISFGLTMFANGTLTTDDAAMYDTVGAPAVAAAATTAPAPTVAPKILGKVEITTGTSVSE